MKVSKVLLSALFFVWTAVLLAIFYGVQKPISAAVFFGVVDTVWAVILAGIIVLNGAGIGTWVLLRIRPAGIAPAERLLLGAGLGLGGLGIIGFAVTAAGGTQPALLLLVQLGMTAVLAWQRILSQVWNDARDLTRMLWRSRTHIHPFVLIAVVLTGLFTTVLALLPPADAFDALFYHLTWPAWLLRDGGLHVYNVPHFWFPHLVEGTFIWTLGVGSDRAAQLLHVAWTVLSVLLVWTWANRLWNERIGWLSVLILVSMPSLPLVASWAYTDFALACYSVATLYAVWRWRDTGGDRWIIVAGFVAGMAMGVKYTSFIVPLTAGAGLVWWSRTSMRKVVINGLVFTGTAAIVAAPWYARNWILVDNPIYPFIFGGQYWDSFRAAWYADAGTGIGANVREVVLLPFMATVGYRDANFYDGRIGPLFLVLFPLTVWGVTRVRHTARRRDAVYLLSGFIALGAGFWTIGVVKSRALWQTRLLLPMLLPLAMLTAVGLQYIDKLDTPTLRVSYIVKIVIAAVIALTLWETALFVVDRNPLAVATGLESREHYLHRVQPAYADALNLLEKTPADAHIYFLFEPRSYYVKRQVQPDPILDNFAHGLYTHDGSVESFAESLRSQGYTHVLLHRRGADFLMEERPDKMPPARVAALDTLTDDLLVPIATTEDDGYELYALPGASD